MSTLDNINEKGFFQPGYEDLGRELTTLEKVFKRQSPSKDTLKRLNPHDIHPSHLAATKEYLTQFINDRKVGALVLSLNEKIDAIMGIDNGYRKTNRIRKATMEVALCNAANDDCYNEPLDLDKAA